MGDVGVLERHPGTAPASEEDAIGASFYALVYDRANQRLSFIATISALRRCGDEWRPRMRDGTIFEMAAEPKVANELNGYSHATSVLRLVAVPEDHEVPEIFGRWSGSSQIATPQASLGTTVKITYGEASLAGRVRAIEAVFLLAIGDDAPLAIHGGIEIKLGEDCQGRQIERGAPVFIENGDLLGFVIAADDGVAMIAPAEPLFSANELEVAPSVRIREHNGRIGLGRHRTAGAPQFGERIRQFGLRIAASSTFFTRTVGA